MTATGASDLQSDLGIFREQPLQGGPRTDGYKWGVITYINPYIWPKINAWVLEGVGYNPTYRSEFTQFLTICGPPWGNKALSMDYEGVMVVHKQIIVNRVLFSCGGWHWGGVFT